MLFPFVGNTNTSTLIKGLTYFGDVVSMAFALFALAPEIYYAIKDMKATQLA